MDDLGKLGVETPPVERRRSGVVARKRITASKRQPKRLMGGAPLLHLKFSEEHWSRCVAALSAALPDSCRQNVLDRLPQIASETYSFESVSGTQPTVADDRKALVDIANRCRALHDHLLSMPMWTVINHIHRAELPSERHLVGDLEQALYDMEILAHRAADKLPVGTGRPVMEWLSGAIQSVAWVLSDNGIELTPEIDGTFFKGVRAVLRLTKLDGKATVTPKRLRAAIENVSRRKVAALNAVKPAD